MMNSLIRFTQRNASVVLLASLLVVIFGLVAARSLKQELLPDIRFPVVTVVTPYPLAAPGEVEAQVTRPLENALANLKDLEGYTSTSSENVSVIVLNFRFGTDLNQAETRVASAVGRVRGALPDTAGEPDVAAIRFGDAPILQLVATTAEGGRDLSQQVQTSLIPRIEALAGVSRVDVAGAQSPEVRVTLRPDELQRFGLTFDSVGQALQTAPLSFPVGTLDQGELQLPVRIGSAASTIAGLSGLVVGSTPELTGQGTPTAPPAMRPVLLSEVAEVALVSREATSLSRFDGREALGLSVYKTQEANTVQVAHAVKALLNEEGDRLGAQVQVVEDQATPIEKGVKSLLSEGAFGALFAVVVVALFLRDTRATLITALSIPVSLLVALILLYTQGLTLNVLTLGGLTVALGRLIDDAIVVVENIYHKLDGGMKGPQATYEGASEVASPVLSSTLATVAVFLPLAFVGGVAGEFLRPLALAVTLSILASLLVAFTLVPLLGGLFLRVRGGVQARQRESRVVRAYAPVIGFVTRRPGLTLVLALLATVGSFALVGRLPTNFIDPGAAERVQVSVALPPGTRLDRADEVARQAERLLTGVDGLNSVETVVGSAGGAFSALGGGSGGIPLRLTLVPDEGSEVAALAARVRTALRTLPGDVSVQEAAGGGGGFSNTLKVNIRADSPDDLQTASSRVLAALKNVSELKNPRSNLSTAQPQLTVRLDGEEAARRGVIGMQAVGAVQAALSGKVVTQLPNGDERLDVRLVYPRGTYDTLDQLRALNLRSVTGAPVPLGEVARIEESQTPVSISRQDGERFATVEADPTTGNISAANSAIKAALKDVDLPQGSSWSLGGVTEQQNQAFGSLGLSIIAAIGLVYLIMVATFRSLLTPFILLISIPLVGVGAFPLMALTNTPIGLSTMFAFLLLTGIVVTNAIVLIDLVERMLEQGSDIRTALVEGSKRRVRPILMTALATIFALVPLALGLSESAGIVGQPLAITVIGGLTSSTFLTLAVVPALYLLLQRRRAGRLRERDLEQATV